MGAMVKDNIQKALEVINANSFASVKDLTEQLGVSRATADRYLQQLEDSRLIRRVQGGAVSLRRDFDFCPSFYYAEGDEYFQERIRIARAAVEMVDGRDCIFLGGGRNTMHLANQLKLAGRGANVVTNSLHVALLLAGTCPVNIVGSMPTNGEGILIGDSSAAVAVDKAFIAPGCVKPDGIYGVTPMIVALEAAFIRKARKVVVLADSEDYLLCRPHKICSIDEVHALVTVRPGLDFPSGKGLEVRYV